MKSSQAWDEHRTLNVEPGQLPINLPPHPFPLPPSGGEGGRRSGEGAVHGPNAWAKAKGGFP